MVNTGGEQQPYITNTSLPYPTYQAEKKTILPYKTTTIFDKYRQHNQQLDTKICTSVIDKIPILLFSITPSLLFP